MREIQVLHFVYTDKAASFNTDWIDVSAGDIVEVFIKYTDLTVGASPSITVKAQETPPAIGGEPDGEAIDIDGARLWEGAYPAARSTEGLDRFTILHAGMWIRLAFTLVDITSVDITIALIIKD